jgi:virginiamycin B lyase
LGSKRAATHHPRFPIVTICILLLAVLSINGAALLVSATGSNNLPKYIDEYVAPTPDSAPLAITVDKDGIVWFTESNATKLGRFDPANHSFRDYLVPGVGDMWGITVDSKGYVWLTQYSGRGAVNPGGAIIPGGHGRLLRFNPANGNFTAVDIPTVGSFPFRLITDEQGRVWFTELLGNRIGIYDPSSSRLREYVVPTNFSGPADLTFDTHGALWFTEAYNRSVAKFNMDDGSFVEYRFSSLDPAQLVSSPVGIAIAEDGNVWVADHGGNWIVEFNPSSKEVIRYPTHFPPEHVYGISIPNGLLIDSQGRVWFSEHGGNSIGYLDPSTQTMVEYPIPTGPLSTALWVALAPDGDVWFTEWSANKIGVVHANSAVPFSLRVSEGQLRLEAGGETSLSLLANATQGIGGNGTFRYSWSSYVPEEVQVTFSTQYPPLAGLANGPGQANLRVSGNVRPGNYTLGLGIDAGSVLIWSMVQTEVTQAKPAIVPLIGNPTLLLVLVFVVALATGAFLWRRRVGSTAPRW